MAIRQLNQVIKLFLAYSNINNPASYDYALAEFNNKLISSPYDGSIPVDPEMYKGKIQTYAFLSHAYVDKLYCIALFKYFIDNGIYLYIDWMHHREADNGLDLKRTLGHELCRSEQLLFLRSPNSELQLKGNKSVRSWCSWELGYFASQTHPDEPWFGEEYLLNLYYNGPYYNLMLHGMRELTNIQNSRMIGKLINPHP